MTEITDTAINKAAGIVFFDGACGACSTGATRLESLLGRRGFLFLPLQWPQATALTHLSEDELRREMKLRLADGRILGGVDALLHLARTVTWARPIAWVAGLGFLRRYLARAYERLARNRYRLSSACRLDRHDHTRIVPWLIASALIALACAARRFVAPWIDMWIIAAAIFASLKLLSWWPLRFHASHIRTIGYLFASATLDAKRFFASTAPSDPTAKQAIRAAGFAFLGATLFWCVARMLPLAHPALVAWTGMIGVVLMLHFGLLQLLSLAWRNAGIDCGLVMNKPLRATSLADFWARWNLPFTTWAFDTVFRPLRRFSVSLATIATFFVSGLIHDLAISVPAGAGFGRPTLYFLIQGAVILVDRKWRLPRFLRRVYALIVLIAPVPLLFHPPFIHNVVLPMMSALGALGKELP
jgi:alginate O-acetyltransferase complex protein AlgI